MKIAQIKIKNYKSLKDVEIYPQSILALVGRNSSGKSNVLKALELFFEGSKTLVDTECFYNHNTQVPIEIVVKFEQLSEWERDEFNGWLDGDTLTVGRVITSVGIDDYDIKNIAYVRVPSIEWLREDKINASNIEKWWADKGNLNINGIDFASVLGNTKPKVGDWKKKTRQFISEHPDDIELEGIKLDNPQGYSNVLKGKLPEFVYIPAVRDVSDEAKVAKTNPFGRLIATVIEKIADEKKLSISEKIKEIEMQLNRVGGDDRIAEIKEVEDKLNFFMSEIMDCDIEIEMALPELKEVFSGVKIFADDGVRTSIETKGHGLQRSMIFTILRAYAELSHVQKAGDDATGRNSIFAIEEPELYLHPQSQRTLMNVLRAISCDRDQIVYATQSSLFVDVGHFDEVCIIRREKAGNEYESKPTQLSLLDLINDLKARKGVDATEEGIRELHSHAFNSIINEAFFADKVVVVEGLSEVYSLPIYGDALDYNFDSNNVSVVHSNGKGSMDRLLRVFNGFKIPVFLWFDGDKNKDIEVKKKTMELLEMFDSAPKQITDLKTMVTDGFAVYEENYEKALMDEITDFDSLKTDCSNLLGPVGKPLMHKYMAEKLALRIKSGEAPEMIMPASIAGIISKVKVMSYRGSLLKTIDT